MKQLKTRAAVAVVAATVKQRGGLQNQPTLHAISNSMHPQNIICRAFGLNTLLLQHKIIRAIHSYCSPAAVPLPDVQTPPSRLQIMISNTCKMHSPAPVASRHPHSMSPPLSNSLKWRQHPTRGIAPSSGMRLRSTLKSLDNILGSQDDDQPPPAQQQAPKQELTQVCIPCCCCSGLSPVRLVHLNTIISMANSCAPCLCVCCVCSCVSPGGPGARCRSQGWCRWQPTPCTTCCLW